MKKESLKTFVSNRINVLFMIFVLALCIRIVLGVFYAHWIGAGEEKIPFATLPRTVTLHEQLCSAYFISTELLCLIHRFVAHADKLNPIISIMRI